MTTVINFYGGPGTGKSTNAARLFTLLKETDRSAELISEYVKQWAYEGKKVIDFDQFYLFGKQARKEYSLFNKVDFLVTDSPILSQAYYSLLYGGEKQGRLFTEMALHYLKMAENSGIKYKHIFLKRHKKYNPIGRYQTESQAKDIDLGLRSFLEEHNIQFQEIEATAESINTLFKGLI